VYFSTTVHLPLVTLIASNMFQQYNLDKWCVRPEALPTNFRVFWIFSIQNVCSWQRCLL